MEKDLGDHIIYDDGRIFSKAQKKYISGNHGKNWYRKIVIDGHKIYVHRLMAETFIPNHENKPNINHKNGIKTDNRVENLEWVTQKENMNHAWDNGLINPVKCQDHPHSKLDNNQVLIIREAIAQGFQQKELARYFKVNTGTISRINTGQRWLGL